MENKALSKSVHHLLKAQAEKNPEAPAIIASDRSSMNYARLFNLMENIVTWLNSMGFGKDDRIAVVLPNGAEMATAFLSVSCCATCAPLNPAYGYNEFGFYLTDLNAKALIIQSRMDLPAIEAAKDKGIPIIELLPDRKGDAGSFTLKCSSKLSAVDSYFTGSDDIALVLHTSGTTAHPKIVPLTHANICISAENIQASLSLTEKDRSLNVMPLFHIHGLIGSLLSSLSAGASVILTEGFNAPKFFDWIEEFKPTWWTAVPTMHHSILSRADGNREIISHHSMRFIRSCSSALPVQVMSKLEKTFGIPVIEAYGMTEASHQVSSNPLPPGNRKPGSVGKSDCAEIAIMDEVGNILPTGTIGEIVIRGENIMKGYENNPDANKLAFINGWFRTGDQGYLDNDNYLFITGRIKEIINRGGEKVSPQEIDEVLMQYPVIAQSITFSIPHPQLGEDIASAVVLHGNGDRESNIKKYLATKLASFKIPHRIIVVDEIPKGPTGKPQRIGMAEKLGLISAHTKASIKREYVPPRNSLEKRLTKIWSQILKIERIGVYDNFFYLGGDSLLAAQVIVRIRSDIHKELSIVDFFDEPTIANMASIIKAEQHSQPSAIVPVGRSGDLPVSFAQQRLWFLDRWAPKSVYYNVPIAFHLIGHCDNLALGQSLNRIVRRHEALRTTFAEVDGQLVQRITPTLTLELPLIELGDLPENERNAEVQRLAGEEARRSFDLARGPLLRASLFRMSAEEHVLLLVMHHIVTDGWSMGVFFQELSILYAACTQGKPSPLPELPIQYVDFAVWQRQWLQGEVLEGQRGYWKKQLDGASVLELPTDRPRPPFQTFLGAQKGFVISQGLNESLHLLSRREDVTLFMTLLAAFQTLLLRYSGQDDIAVGSPIANRNRVEVEGMIGFFVNTLVLRTDLRGNPSFRELLGRVREVALGGYAHHHIPFEKLVEELNPERNTSHTTLFQVMLVLQNAFGEVPEFPGLSIEPFAVGTDTAKFDLTLYLREDAGGMRGNWEYNTDLFDGPTIERMIGHFLTLLEGIVVNPDLRLSALPLLTEAERYQLLVEWNDTKRDYPKDKCIHELFEKQVERTPDAIALIFEDQQLTYRELNRRVNQLAHYLRKHGVGPEVLVGICMERSLEMVIGLLGILKAGGAYVPLDPAYPKERLAFMLEDARVPILLTQEGQLSTMPEYNGHVICLDRDCEKLSRESEVDPVSGVNPGNLAYVIYTSGSTGKPKGVQISHRAVVNFLFSMLKEPGLSENDVLLSVTTLSFDIAALELFLPLITGARTVLVSREMALDGSQLLKRLKEGDATVMQATPATWRLLLEAGWHNKIGLKMLCGGEALPRDLASQLLERGESLWNMYGPTETTIWSMVYRIESKASPMLIGRPIANTQIYILDRNFQLVPVGVAGELCIGGEGLARGYLNRPELTAEKFIEDPFSAVTGARLYRTGDLVRYLPDGNIEFLGRIDHQVKIRGFRIELGEIESVLEQHEAVKEAVVMPREDIPGEKRLVAYLVPNGKQTPSVSLLRQYLKEKLPDYMVPNAFVMLEKFPLTPNGKVDRKALPSPTGLRPELESNYVAPQAEIDRTIAAIWQEVLRLEKIGIHDNFFQVGGYSLLAIRVISRINKAFQVDLPLPSFFEMPTISGLSKTIEKLRDRGSAFKVPPIVPISRESRRMKLST